MVMVEEVKSQSLLLAAPQKRTSNSKRTMSLSPFRRRPSLRFTRLGVHSLALSLLLLLIASSVAVASLEEDSSLRGWNHQSDDGAAEPDSSSFPEKSLIEMQFGPDEYEGEDKMRLVLKGVVSLVDVRVTPNSLRTSDAVDEEGKDEYGNVEAHFCRVEWGAAKDDPSRVPTFRDIVGASPHCADRRYSFDLKTLVTAARLHDNSPSSASVVRPNEPSAFLFHLGKSGSTLLTNALAVVDPTRNRVINEHPAVAEVLNACDSLVSRHGVRDCSRSKQVRLFEDVVYLLGRTADRNVDRLYVKVQSRATPNMDVVRSAYPSTKWAFLHRDADEVLAKHASAGNQRPSCAKNGRNPSGALKKYMMERRGGGSTGVEEEGEAEAEAEATAELRNMSREEACSAYLATVFGAAAKEHEATGTGLMVDYDADLKRASEDPSGLMDVLRYLLDEQDFDSEGKLSPEAMGRVQEQLGRYALRRHNDRSFSAKDEVVEVSEEMRAANAKHLGKLIAENFIGSGKQFGAQGGNDA